MRNFFKEIDSLKKIQLLLAFIVINGPFFTIMAFTGFLNFTTFLISSLLSVFLSIFSVYMTEKIGSALGGGMLWSSRKTDFRETLSADLTKAKFKKSKGEFEESLNLIDGVLDKAPDFPDALYIKAQVLWEGFENAADAKNCLTNVMQKVHSEETLHKWASTLYDGIIKAEKDMVCQGIL